MDVDHYRAVLKQIHQLAKERERMTRLRHQVLRELEHIIVREERFSFDIIASRVANSLANVRAIVMGDADINKLVWRYRIFTRDKSAMH